MPLEIIRNDITKVRADAIVNPTDSTMSGSGGVDRAVHEAAGPELLAACQAVGGCKPGEARLTKAYGLPSKYVIHTVGPLWHGGSEGEEEILANCYRNSLALAKQYKLKSIAFPLVATGVYGYPKDRALRTAISIIGEFLLDNEMTVFLVVYDKRAFVLSEKLFSSVKQYIDDKYVEGLPPERVYSRAEVYRDAAYSLREPLLMPPAASASKRNLADVVDQVDETFSRRLLRLIDEKHMTDVEVYHRANVDRKLFSKIRTNPNYHPAKATAIAFAIALRLNIDETRDLLLAAGFALSRSSKSDVIIQFFIEDGDYDIFEINAALFKFEQEPLGV